MSEQQQHYDVFLPGELVDLVVPNERAIHVDRWYDWFNDPVLTRHMEQGMYPKSPQQQEAFLAELRRLYPIPATLSRKFAVKNRGGRPAAWFHAR